MVSIRGYRIIGLFISCIYLKSSSLNTLVLDYVSRFTFRRSIFLSLLILLLFFYNREWRYCDLKNPLLVVFSQLSSRIGMISIIQAGSVFMNSVFVLLYCIFSSSRKMACLFRISISLSFLLFSSSITKTDYTVENLLLDGKEYFLFLHWLVVSVRMTRSVISFHSSIGPSNFFMESCLLH